MLDLYCVEEFSECIGEYHLDMNFDYLFLNINDCAQKIEITIMCMISKYSIQPMQWFYDKLIDDIAIIILDVRFFQIKSYNSQTSNFI